jgi:site-specific recombinase XerD
MNTTLSSLVDVFASTKLTEGKSKVTVSWYRDMLARFVTWSGDGKLTELTLQNARAFIGHLQAKKERYEDHPMSKKKAGGLSPHTIHGYVRSLKVFSSWLAEEGFTPSDVLAKLKRPKLPETVVEVLTDEEINRILADINPNSFLGSRLHAMVLLMLDSGIRATELLTLTINAIDLTNGRIKVIGKGNKERVVPIGGTTKKTLMRYLNLYRPDVETPQVFTSVDGQALTYTALSHTLMRLGERVDVPRLHAHLFRHSFACRYLENGGDVTSLKLLMGHSSIETTMIYVHLSQKFIDTRHHVHSPVDRLPTSSKKAKK